MRYRICYQKNDDLIFISHLDLQKMFQRAFRRAKIDLAYSEGFNPHPKMSYSPPLSLFVSSAEEYLDVSVTTSQDTDHIKEKLTETLPKALIINEVRLLEENSENLSNVIEWGTYRITLENNDLPQNMCEIITSYFEFHDEILITKRNKKKRLIQKNIKENILSLTCESSESGIVLTCILALRNNEVLNPVYVVKALRENIEELKYVKTLSMRKTSVLWKNSI